MKKLEEQRASAMGMAYVLDELIVQDLEIDINLENIKMPATFATRHSLKHKKVAAKEIYRVKPNSGFAYDVYSSFASKSEVKTNQKKLWLSGGKFNLEEFSFLDLLNGKIPTETLRAKVVLIGDESQSQVLRTEAKILANYMSTKWIKYFRIPSFLIFFLLVAMGILFVLSTYPARIFSFLAFNALVFIGGQFLYSIFGLHIETMPLVASSTLILLLSVLVDVNTIFLKEKLKAETGQIGPEVSREIFVRTQPDNTEEELRRKFYCELEDSNENVALALQEKTITELMTIQNRIEEMVMNNGLSEEAASNLRLLNMDFNKTMDELDNILFKLVPFQLEKDKGLLNPIQHLADKVVYKSKGVTKAKVVTDLKNLRLDNDIKVNVYRILERLVELLIEKSKATELKISVEDRAGVLNIDINYNGLNINPDREGSDSADADYRFRDLFRRAKVLGARVNFTNDIKTSTDLINKINLELSL